MNTLNDIEVSDRHSFAQFLQLLHQDFLHNPQSWQNSNLENFLKALVSYEEDIQGYYKNKEENVNPDIPTWKLFADILKGAKVYE